MLFLPNDGFDPFKFQFVNHYDDMSVLTPDFHELVMKEI